MPKVQKEEECGEDVRRCLPCLKTSDRSILSFNSFDKLNGLSYSSRFVRHRTFTVGSISRNVGLGIHDAKLQAQ